MIDLTMADLADTDFSGILFESCDLSGTNFDTANLDRSTFRNCKANNTIFSNCSLVKAEFAECDLRQADFSSAVLRGASLSGCLLAGADLSEISVNKCKLIDVDISNVSLDKARLTNSSATRVSISHIGGGALTVDKVIADDLKMEDVILSSLTWKDSQVTGGALRDVDIGAGELCKLTIRNVKIERFACRATATGLDLSVSEIQESDLTPLGLSTAIMWNTSVVDCTWPPQTGKTNWLGSHSTSPNLLRQPVQDLRGISQVLRREIADAQFLRERFLRSTSLRSRFALRLWGASCIFGQSLGRLAVWTFILMVVHALAYLASCHALFDLRRKPQLALTALRETVESFFGLKSAGDSAASAATSAVLTLGQLIGFVILGLFISVGASSISRLSAE